MKKAEKTFEVFFERTLLDLKWYVLVKRGRWEIVSYFLWVGGLFLHWRRKKKLSLCFGKAKSPPFCTCGKMMKSGLSLLLLSPPFLNFPAASFPFSFSPRRRDGRPNSPSFYFFFLKTFHASPQFRNARSRNALKSPLIFPFLMIKILVRVHKITHWWSIFANSSRHASFLLCSCFSPCGPREEFCYRPPPPLLCPCELV